MVSIKNMLINVSLILSIYQWILKNVLNIDNNKKHFLKPSNQYITIISEDHVTVKIGEIMLKIQLYVTVINYILQYIFIENSYFKL